jgi:hypothetical protein
MIARYDSDGSLILITQNDHAKLSGLLAAHWGNSQFERPRPYASSVRAAHYHDLGWLQYETSPQFDAATGKTPNFLDIRTDNKHLEAFQRSHEWLSSIDPYAGLLVTKHRTGVYQARYGTLTQPTPPKPRELNPELKEYISKSEGEQKGLAAGFDPREFEVNFHLLQVWDLVSLWICCNEHLKEITVHPVPTGYGDGAQTSMRLQPIAAKTISVDPFPFDQPSLQLSFICKRFAKPEFKDAQAFDEAFFGASPQIQTFTFVDPARTKH